MTKSGTSTRLDYVELFAAAAERFAVAVATADLHARVPACPEWTAYDLVCHLGNVHSWAATIVETGRSAAEQNDEPRTHRARVASEWYAGKAEDLYEVLRTVDPEKPCWNFAFRAGTAAFWRRRQLHEVTVHSFDLVASGGTSNLAVEVTPELAADGVDEVLNVFLYRMHRRGHPATLTAPVCLVATDVDRAWTVSPRPVVSDPDAAVPTQPRGSSSEAAPALIEGPPLVVDRRHPRSDQVSGPAEALYRALWKRGPRDGLTISGDVDRVNAFLDSRLVP